MTASSREMPRLAATVALALGLALAGVAAVAVGAVRIPPARVVAAVSALASGGGGPDAAIVGLRAARVALAALVGACLAVAGALFQALFRNPLADPYILGTSAGAGLGATIALALGGPALAMYAVPPSAFAGALLAIAMVVGVSRRRGRIESLSMLLAGVALSYTLAAVTSMVMVLSRNTMTRIVFWMMGGLSGASWPFVTVTSAMLAVGLTVALLLGRELNVMLLGEERAGQLGVGVERLKLVVLAAASLLTAAAVAVSGLIGFVGLMTPHMVRVLLGPDHRSLLPASALAGALVLVVADMVARVAIAPVELPVGVVTALAGGPFFVWLLARRETAS